MPIHDTKTKALVVSDRIKKIKELALLEHVAFVKCYRQGLQMFAQNNNKVKAIAFYYAESSIREIHCRGRKLCGCNKKCWHKARELALQNTQEVYGMVNDIKPIQSYSQTAKDQQKAVRKADLLKRGIAGIRFA